MTRLMKLLFPALVAISTACSAADIKISALPSASAFSGTELVPVVQSSATKAGTLNQIRTYAQSGLATVATSGSASSLTGLAPIGLSGSATDLTTGTIPAARLPVFDNTTKGAVPASGGGTSNYLRADGTWAAPAGGGGGGGSSVSTQSGTAYTAVVGDANTYVRFTNAGAVTFTIPTNASVAYAVGTELQFEQAGAGTVTIAAAGGVTVNSRGGAITTAGQYSVGVAKKVATDTWTLAGDIQ